MTIESSPECAEEPVFPRSLHLPYFHSSPQDPQLKLTSLQGHHLWRAFGLLLCYRSQPSKTKTLAFTALFERYKALLSSYPTYSL